MKKFKLQIILLVLVHYVTIAQNGPVDFEAGSVGQDWTWTTFENDSNPPLEFVANPDTSGINSSNTVAQFTALVSGQPFAGVETMHGSDIGTFTLDSENAIVKMKVYKSVISNVGIKFATPEGASTGELLVPNTVVNEWEELTFDFTSIIGEPSSNGIDQLIIFPDFNARNTTTVNLFDEIIFGNQTLSFESTDKLVVKAFPNPVVDILNIQSAYKIITEVKVIDILGRQVLKQNMNSTNFAIDLSDLKNGIFFVEIIANSDTEVLKLIKK